MKRFIAMLLVAVMLFSVVPTNLYAIEPVDSTIVESNESSDIQNQTQGITDIEENMVDETQEETVDETQEETVDETQEETVDETQEEEAVNFDMYEYEKDPQTVEYNTGKYFMNVGKNIEYAQKYEDFYKLVSEENTYTIRVENDAFFPYQVQFTQNGQSELKWFMTPDSVVEFGGYTFSLESKTTQEDTLSQIGFVVNGEYVAAYPQEKSFEKNQIMPRSLLPLEEIAVKVDLGNVNITNLKEVEVKTLISKFKKIPSGEGANVGEYQKAVWVSRNKDNIEEYSILTPESKVDLSHFESGSEMSFILGDAKQLNPNNKRYLVELNLKPISLVKNVNFYKEIPESSNSPAQRMKIETLKPSDEDYNGRNFRQWIDTKLKKEDINLDHLYLSLELNDDYNKEDWKVYDGSFDTPEELQSAQKKHPDLEITDKVLNQDLGELNTGHREYFHGSSLWSSYTFVYQKNPNLMIIVNNNVKNELGLTYRILMSKGTAKEDTHVYLYRQSDDKNILRTGDIDKNKFDTFKFRISFEEEQNFDNLKSEIKKIVPGLYHSEKEAENQADIKNDILVSNIHQNDDKGYSITNLKGFQFTVFFKNGMIRRYELDAVIREPKEKVIVPFTNGPVYSKTSHFDITGYKDGVGNVLMIPKEHDDYYYMGYQTALVFDEYDSLNLKSISPTFRINSSDFEVYAAEDNTLGGVKQESGVSILNFSKGEVQYTATGKDQKSLRNYWVNFTENHTGGAKLFVNAVNGKEKPEREIFLTKVQKNKHDIFIANIGDTALTGLKVELQDAKNLKLDEYWTVGGENNSTLKPFTTAQKEFGKLESVLANTAKIRLLKQNDGEVSGKLKITADGQEPVTINLKGYAGDPKLTTTAIPKAVKFVPYAVQLLHNNKYPWNDVTITKEWGDLPAGVELRPNGEIYGVPKEKGKFEFGVKMENSDSAFSDSYQRYTLVVEDNTNRNVIDASDENYKIKVFLGRPTGNQYADYLVTSSEDQVFTSEGEHREFIDFWLNGEKLKADDYIHVDGSTKITIKSQTFRAKAKQGVNTIAAEFRVDGKRENLLKRTAQNFKLDLSNEGGSSSGSSSSGGSSSGSSGSGISSNVTKKETPAPAKKEVKPQEKKQNLSQRDNVEVKELKPIEQKIDLQFSKDSNLISIPKEALEKAMKQAREERKKLGKNHPVVLDMKLQSGDDALYSVNFDLSTENLKQLTKEKNVSVKVDLGKLSAFELSPQNIEFLSKQVDKDVKFELSRSEGQFELKIKSGEKLIENLGSDLKISVPKLAQGEVLVLVRSNGEEIILKKSAVVSGDVFALLQGTGTVKVINNAKEFSDVKDSDWFADAVKFVSSRELFVGMPDGSFDPQSDMSRGMIASVFYRLEDAPKVNSTSKFADVKDEWFADAVNWAAQNKIVSGYGDSFGANDSLTREQLATLVYRYANIKELKTEVRGDISKYADINSISGWASDSVRWAVGNNLMVGFEGNLNPEKSITRAEVAQVVKRLIELMVK